MTGASLTTCTLLEPSGNQLSEDYCFHVCSYFLAFVYLFFIYLVPMHFHAFAYGRLLLNVHKF